MDNKLLVALHLPTTTDFPLGFNVDSGMQTNLLIFLETMGKVLNITLIGLNQQFLGFVPRTALAEDLLELWGAHVA